VKELLRTLGNPERDYPIILVGGTNGKGSTAAMISSILDNGSMKVGTFTKPHLCRFTERMVIGGTEITQKETVDVYHRVKDASDKLSEKGLRYPTFFELSVAMAYAYFSTKQVDVAVMEVGMGGRLDATNACLPTVSVITNVSLEHTSHLGETVEKIAVEKGGIIKPGVPTVTTCSAPALEIIERICNDLGSKLTVVPRDFGFLVSASDLDGVKMSVISQVVTLPELKVALVGRFQATNAALAIASVLQFVERIGHAPLSPISFAKGLEMVRWPGRIEIMQENPLVILDCAKDPFAASTLVSELAEILPWGKFKTVVSISSDKDYGKILTSLHEITEEFILTRHSVMGRALPVENMACVLDELGAKYVCEPTVRDAVRKAMQCSEKSGDILVTGSVFTVGEARPIWTQEPCDGF
jgi:dihydrofolate synthase/folylpolyglutamate synthase